MFIYFFRNCLFSLPLMFFSSAARCSSSSRNGEELIRDSGIPLLATLLSRCMCIVQPTTPAHEPAAKIVTSIMHTFSALSLFESGRVEILKFAGLVEDIVHCTELLNLVPPLWILLCKQLLMFPFHLNCKMVCLPLAFYGTALPSFCYCYYNDDSLLSPKRKEAIATWS